MGSEPTEVLASGSCQIDQSITTLPGPEAFDTATVIMRFANGKEAMIDVCRQAPYGYDQRAEVLGKTAMIMTDNTYPKYGTLRLQPWPRQLRSPAGSARSASSRRTSGQSPTRTTTRGARTSFGTRSRART